jgi:hypothetical protein
VDRTKAPDNEWETVADVPKVRKSKAKITRWMTLWVFSVILYLFKDMVSEVFSGIYKKIASFLQRLADNIYGKRNIQENLKVPPPSNPNLRDPR